MFKPIILGNKTFPINIIQGPLAGISCAPFRYLTWKYGKPAFSYTEMISCKTIIHQRDKVARRYLQKHPEEGPVGFQLSASEVSDLAEASKIVTANGADLIDLNCGCPVKKIRSKGAGSSLLTSPSKLYHLIRAMKENTHLPVSIKIRVEGKSTDKFNHHIAQVVKDSGVDFLIVHGRHWTEHYETPCQHEQIAFFVDALNIPVIGNGDIACINSLKAMFATGCAGVMLARAGVGQPWLTQRLLAESKGEAYQLPPMSDIGAMFLEHTYLLADLLMNERQAILQARKFAKYYARSLLEREDFVRAVHDCEQLAAIENLTAKFFI